MCRILRYAVVAVLSLALCASGATLGLARMSQGNAAQAGDAGHAEHDNHGHHAHHAMAQTAHEDGTQPTSDHPSKNCCSACIVASPLPGTPGTTIQRIASPAEFSSLSRFDVSFAFPVDPGIPKHLG
jgi:hypothetical protein